ncbi:Bug family tripartite tricarboxylate transporter substrate binding protein [Cupriavidus lacunae]|nr:tripartite tricarboxylate transporter substrate binding protein [Cupriavidus lacunae]
MAVQCLAALAIAAGTPAQAETWPGKPIRLVAPVAAGSATDLVARELASRLSKELGQPVVVDNRPGANTGIGIMAVARSPADGYTWLLVSSTLTSSPALTKVTFDPVTDFTPVSILGYATTIAVASPGLKVHNVSDLIALAKSNPGAINYAYPSVGALGHLHSAMLAHTARITLSGVPYKGSSPAMTDLLAGRIQFMFAPPGVVQPYVKAGKLVALGVVGAERLPLYPNVPTLKEQGIRGVDLEAWMGVLMPAGTPQSIVSRANAAIDHVLREPGASEAFDRAGIRTAPGGSSMAFARRIRDDLVEWPRLFALAKISRLD